MAKATKAVKATSNGASTRSKTARTKKTTTKKTRKAAKPATKNGNKAAKQTGKGLSTHVGWVATLIPGPIGRITYVQRTLDILDDGARKRANLRKRQMKQLGHVWDDLQKDVQQQLTDVELSTRKHFDGIADKVRDTRVIQEVTELPDRMTDTVDVVLARVGLVRKSLVLENVGRKALPATVR